MSDLKSDLMSAGRLRRIVRLTITPGRGAEARAALATLRDATLMEPGCEEFDFYQQITDPDQFILIEDFADDAALTLHMEKPYTRAFFDLGLLKGGVPIARAWLS